jgi:hypothetical protein
MVGGIEMEDIKRKTHKEIEEHLPENIVQPFKELVAQVSGARKVRGMTMSDLHRASGVGESTINRFEGFKNGKISTVAIMQMLDAMDLKLVIMPKNVDMETIRQANAILIKYSQIAKGHIPE